MWDELERPWQKCFQLAWESFRNGSIPIGAVVVNHKGEIISEGRSLQYESTGEPGEIYRHKLSHAELNALLKFSEFDHPNIRKYTLYTTLEPCPLCFGALVMSHVRSLKYAARDRIAGSVCLAESSDYLRSKNISIEGPFHELEEFQMILNTVYELKRNLCSERLLDAWKLDCPAAVKLGTDYYQCGLFDQFLKTGAGIEEVFDAVMQPAKSI